MGEVGEGIVDAAKDVGGYMTGGLVDFHKGRVFVPFSSGHVRNFGKSIANQFTAGQYRKEINQGLDTSVARHAGTAIGVIGGAYAGAAAGPAAGLSAGTGALAGGTAAAGIAQADAMKQGVPNPNEVAPVSNESSAVQKAVAETASRRSRSRGFRSTILSQNFLSPSNPALKQTYGS